VEKSILEFKLDQLQEAIIEAYKGKLVRGWYGGYWLYTDGKSKLYLLPTPMGSYVGFKLIWNLSKNLDWKRFGFERYPKNMYKGFYFPPTTVKFQEKTYAVKKAFQLLLTLNVFEPDIQKAKNKLESNNYI
jgi:hypothetical protein